MENNNLILVSDWEKVDKDDFYLTDNWKENEDIDNIKRARKLQKENNLYIGYIVDAKQYAIYSQMDAEQVLINSDGDVIIHCESEVIDDKHKFVIDYEY